MTNPCSTRVAQNKRLEFDLDFEIASKFVAAFLLLLFVAAPAFAQSDTINVDSGVLITNVNLWIPIMFAILALPAGIRIAMRVVNFIIDAFVDAFR